MKLTRLSLFIFVFSNIETSVAEKLAVNFNPDFLIFSDGKAGVQLLGRYDYSYWQADGQHGSLTMLDYFYASSVPHA